MRSRSSPVFFFVIWELVYVSVGQVPYSQVGTYRLCALYMTLTGQPVEECAACHGVSRQDTMLCHAVSRLLR